MFLLLSVYFGNNGNTFSFSFSTINEFIFLFISNSSISYNRRLSLTWNQQRISFLNSNDFCHLAYTWATPATLSVFLSHRRWYLSCRHFYIQMFLLLSVYLGNSGHTFSFFFSTINEFIFLFISNYNISYNRRLSLTWHQQRISFLYSNVFDT